MILLLDHIEDEPLDFDRGLALPDLLSESGRPLVVGELRMTGQALRGSRGVELRARWSATVELPCSRCLEQHQVTLEDSTFLIFAPGPEPADHGGERALDLEEASIFRVEGPRADLRPVAAEQLLLALPLKPLCHPGCAGLCPTCGANRNRIECGCRPTEVDPRLAGLREIRDRMR